MANILIVDDEEAICWSLREFLQDLGHTAGAASNVTDGLLLAQKPAPTKTGRQAPWDLVLLDVRMPGRDGLSAIADFQRCLPEALILIMTAFGNLDTAVKALSGGAWDYLVKPFDLDQIAVLVNRAADQISRARDRSNAVAIAATPETPTAAKDDPERFFQLAGTSPAMHEVFKRIALVAASEIPVLITGESGTGKELVARAIHRHSARGRSGGPFVPISLAALSSTLIERELFGHRKGAFTGATDDHRGWLELAAGGTVLLDEIGDVPLEIQVKLLRVLEQREITPVGDVRARPIDVRIIAATNRPMDQLIASGQFREDLFFRLNVFPIHLPPLRERRTDIPVLALHLVSLLESRDAPAPVSPNARLTEDLVQALQERPWFGNVRELRNAMEHALLWTRGGAIRPEHLPQPLPRTSAAVTDPLANPAASPHQSTTESDPQVPNGPNLAEIPDAERIPKQIMLWTLAQLENLARDGEEPEESSLGPQLQERFWELVEPAFLQTVLRHCRDNRAAAANILGIHRATLRQKLRRYGIK